MKLIAPLLVAAVIGLGIAAGAGARPAAHASDPGTQIISALNKLVSKIQADKGNCTKMAADIRAWKRAHAGDFARWRAWGKHLSLAQKRAYAHRWASRVGGILRRMVAGVLTCAQNPKVQAALQDLDKSTKGP